MDLIVERGAKSLGYLMDYEKVYFDLGSSNTFQITVRATKEYHDLLKTGNLIYSPGTEYGGIIGRVKLSKKRNVYTISGFTFRGLLEHKIIEPDYGNDYEILDITKLPGTDLNDCIAWTLNKHCNNATFAFYAAGKSNVKVSKNYQFARYCTGLSGLTSLVKGSGCRLEIRAEEVDGMCKVLVGAVPVTTYDNLASNDGASYFASDSNKMGINYLIVLGKGKLKSRLKVRLYVDERTGTIKRQLNPALGYPNVNGIIKAAIYELSSEDNWTKLKESGIEKLKELVNTQSFSASVENIDAEIGDVVGAVDDISGETFTSPITEKAVTIEAGHTSVTYKTKSEVDIDEDY